mmetsp:Transcript_50884/g.80700  ORF Transcript_50884/g.80700 Transcript_50884/m.80700 type:complete len:543 (-) Transcript_50884:12-1640(-)
MSEAFRKFVKRDPPPAATIRFRCAKLHKNSQPNSDSSVQEYNTIYDVLRSRGWKEHDTDSNDWNIFWADKDWIHDTFDRIHLDPHQRINHFRNHYELTRKDLLIKNMKKMRRYYEREGRPDEAEKYNVCPITFVVPQEYSMFVEEFKKHSGATWIMKPIGKSQGAGIFLVNRLAQLQAWRPPTTWAPGFERDRKKADKDKDKDQDDDVEGTGTGAPEPFVVQKYVDGPLLVGGKKFDIRLYAMVTSYQPLTIYMHRGGFCRFSMSRYTSDKSDMTNLGKHLTNVAVQKHSGKAAYKRTGAKWDVSRLKSYLINTAGLDVTNRLLSDIESIVINSLLAVQKVMINDKHCFEVYGYDILIDSSYKPWLLEVNASPSLTANTTVDYEFKYGMLDDALSIIDLEKYLSGSELQVGGFDLLYRDGQRYAPPDGSEIRSYLGCSNNRLAQLKKLAKTRAWESREGRRADASEEFRPEAAGGKFARSVRPYPAGIASNVTETAPRQSTREKRGFNRGQTMAVGSEQDASSKREWRHSSTFGCQKDLDTT